MKYIKNYCEEKEVSTSKLNEAQRTLYYIAENMKMNKSISEEGYRHFQMAIKALEQESKTGVLDKIRVEVEALPKTYPFMNHIDMYVKENDVKKIIDKYKAESEE